MHRCKLFTLLYCMVHQQAHCTRVVVTFTNVPHSLEGMTRVEGLSIVKQYGRRLVLALPPTRESLIDSEFEFLNTLGTIQGVENDTSVLIQSVPEQFAGANLTCSASVYSEPLTRSKCNSLRVSV